MSKRKDVTSLTDKTVSVKKTETRKMFLSVQCYVMHGQNINLFVCVSVCPSHFLSTRLQVRSLNGFFTVDSLKEADLPKDVPFGGLDDE